MFSMPRKKTSRTTASRTIRAGLPLSMMGLPDAVSPLFLCVGNSGNSIKFKLYHNVIYSEMRWINFKTCC